MKVMIIVIKQLQDLYIKNIIVRLQKLNRNIDFKLYYLYLDYEDIKFYKRFLLKQSFSKRKEYYQNIYDIFFNHYKNYAPEIVLFLNCMAPKKYLEKIRTCGVKLIYYGIDTLIFNQKFLPYPLTIKGRKIEGIDMDCINFFDVFFSYNMADVITIANQYNIRSEYLPLGYDEDVYHPINLKQEIDISFIGSRSESRLEILNFIAKKIHEENRSINFIVIGITIDDCEQHILKKWRSMWKFRKNYPYLEKHLVNKRLISPNEAAIVYNSSKLNLNIDRVNSAAINPRTFEILSTNSFQLMDKKKSYFNLICPGKDVVVYADKFDLWNKIIYYLQNMEERKLIASAGHLSVKGKLDLTNCAKKLSKEFRKK